jgi:hypothetical protein
MSGSRELRGPAGRQLPEPLTDLYKRLLEVGVNGKHSS